MQYVGQKKNLTEIVSVIDELPSLSIVILKIEEMLNDPDLTAGDLVQVISSDQALMSRILRVVNSGFYGIKNHIGSLKHAIMMLGFRTIKNIVLTTEVFKVFSENEKNVFDRYLFWKHSLACGCAAKVTAEFLGMEKSEEIFIGGLLHDIGKLVLDHYAKREFKEVIEKVVFKDIPIIDAETEVFGFNHAMVGKLLAEKWGFPDSLKSMIGYHHVPLKSGNFFKESASIKIGDFLARAFSMGFAGDDKISYIEPDLHQMIDKIDKNRFFSTAFSAMMSSNDFLDSLL